EVQAILTAYNASIWLPGITVLEENKILSDGTGPLAVVNDPIGYVKDINAGFHVIQETTADKPILTAANTWSFDGVNDNLSYTGTILDGNGDHFRMACHKPGAVAATRSVSCGTPTVSSRRIAHLYIGAANVVAANWSGGSGSITCQASASYVQGE